MKPPVDRPCTGAARSTGSASTAGLPPRARKLLEGILDLSIARLEPVIGQTIEDFERELFRAADQPRDSVAQRLCFETLRAFRSRRADVAPRFFARLEQVLFNLTAYEAGARETTARRSELALVSEAEIEIAAAIAETGGRAEVRASVPLYLLGQRFGVLAGAPAFDPDQLPVGPRSLARVLIDTVAEIEMPAEHRTLLLRQFERHLLALAPTFYEAINAYLVGERILPHLSFAPIRRGPAAPAPALREQRVERGPATETAARGRETPAMRDSVPASRPAGGQPAAPPARGRPAETSVPGWLGIPTPAPVDEDVARASEVFATIRELLISRRQLIDRFAARTDAAHGHRVSREEVEEALRALQRRPTAPVYAGGRIQAPNVQHLKQDLLAQLRGQVPEGKIPRLSDEDADTIDLVGMLFEQITRDLRPSGLAQLLLAKLQTPLLRTALQDREFFVRRSHPARRLLNSIAETGMYWLDAEDTDRELVDKMHHLVDRVCADFDGDLALFETLLEDLSAYMQTIARRAEVAERRHVEAARGRERLEIARERAATAIAARTQGRRLPPILGQVLEQTWTDVLALTELRHGEDSPSYRRRLELVARLIHLAGAGGPAPGSAELAELRGEVIQGLALVGLTPTDAEAVVRALFSSASRSHSPENDPAMSPGTELPLRLKTHGRMGGGDAPMKREERPPNAEELAMIERIKALPFGTWVEFVVNQQGDRARRRLSWYSPLTGRCLFVNQRGQKVDERSLVSLARELVRGNARIIEERGENLIDRAWRQVVDALKTFVGGRPNVQPREA